MKNAAEYLKENVVKRLTGKMRADQIVALSQAQLSSRSSFVPGQSNHTTTSTFFGDSKGGKEGGENGGGGGRWTFLLWTLKAPLRAPRKVPLRDR